MEFERVPEEVKVSYDRLPADAQICLLYLVKEVVKLKKRLISGDTDRVKRI